MDRDHNLEILVIEGLDRHIDTVDRLHGYVTMNYRAKQFDKETFKNMLVEMGCTVSDTGKVDI